ncbi:ABC exporter membrane fusion protein, DevB family (plasmid) [Stanieria sp. NIES-3757]|nr:ABC exporter membrane fusion protein, DevB family [Stanieria sp. NIES-3757]
MVAIKSEKFPKFLFWASTTLIVINVFVGVRLITRNGEVTQSDSPPTDLAQPIEITTPDQVGALGTLEPEGEVISLAPPTRNESTRVKQLLVKVGERVKTGQIVAILDNRNRALAALTRTQAQVKIARALLEQRLAGAPMGEIDAQKARIKNIELEIKGQMNIQLANIERLEAELRGNTQAQTATIERFKAEFHNAQMECDRFESLFQSGAVSDSERDRICLQAQTATRSLEEAEVNRQLTISTHQKQIEEAKASLQRTEATLAQQQIEAQATLGRIEEVRPVDVAVAEAQLADAQAAMAQAQVDLELAYMRSPQAGQILKINTRPGEMIGEQGILQLGQTNQMIVRAEVYETEIGRVRRGQKAIITSNGFVGQLEGIVEQIELQVDKQDVLSTDPVADANARVVEVKIRLTDETSQKVAGLTNLQVNAVIFTPVAPRKLS